jgi:uncharacterized membrane protein
MRDAQGVFAVLPLPNSQATGINDRGIVVGFTQPTTTTAAAFVWQHERATLLNYPGSTFTQALGENDRGQIVGTYNDAAGTGHGFVYGHGAFQSIDVPGSSATVVNGINDRGQIVGFFADAAGNTVGFVGTPTNSRATTLVASLLGKNEVPGPGDANGGGTALVTLYPSRSQVCYSIAVGGLQGTVTEAHIHQGAAGATGPVVVHFMAPDQGSASGCIGVDANLISQLAQNPAGFYVNVHTTTFMGGAARGQLSK